MPEWITDFISFLQANDVLLSSVSSFIAILAAILSILGFVFGWWWRLYQRIRSGNPNLLLDKKAAISKAQSSSAPMISSITNQKDEISVSAESKISVQPAATIAQVAYHANNSSSFRSKHETEIYLERLQSSILEGFRVDQYVGLTMESLESEEGSTLDALQHALRSSFEISAEDWPKGGDVVLLDAAVSSNRLVAFLGNAGSGKTTSLRYLALKQIEKLRTSEIDLVPIWISLGNWSDKNMLITEFLWQEYSKFVDAGVTNKNAFEKSIKQGKFLFLLDGLNELPQRERADIVHEGLSKGDLKQQTSDKRENDLLVLARDSRSRFIISCRLLDYAHQAGWREFRVLPLNDEQIVEFAQKHLKSNYGAFQAILKEKPDLQGLIRVPFLLRSLIRLVQEGLATRPSDRFELVQFVCQSAIAREAFRLQLDASTMTNVIGHISWLLLKNGSIGSFFSLSDNDLQSTLLLKNNIVISVKDAITWGESAGLFISSGFELNGTPKHRFLHQLVQEALALIFLQSVKDELQDNEWQNNENKDLGHIVSLLKVGYTHARWGLLSEAEQNLTRALELCSISESSILRAAILDALSNVYRQWRRAIDALPLSEQAVELLDHQKPSKLLAQAYDSLGETYAIIRKPYLAEKYYIKSLDIYRMLGNVSDTAYASLLGLAEIYSSPSGLYKPIKAFRIYDNCINVFQKENDSLGLARVQLAMAHLYRFQGDVTKSLELFQKCEQLFLELNAPWLRLDALEYGGILLRDAKRFDEAIQWGQNAQNLANELRATRRLIVILVWIRAWTASYQGKHLESLDWVKQAYKLAMQLSSSSEIVRLYCGGFGTTYWRAKNFSEAAKYFSLYKQKMDYQEKLYVSWFYKLAIDWAETLGKHVSTNFAARFITEICWWIVFALNSSLAPTNWLGNKLFRFQWWLHRFTWIK